MEKQQQQETIRKFLLGDLAERERAALEDGFLGDAEIFEQIEDAENDLVDDYVASRLHGDERARFENYYLAQPENRAKVAAARALRQVAATPDGESEIITARADARASFWQSIQNFFASLRIAPAMAAAAVVLLFVAGSLWLVFRAPGTNEIAQSPTPTPEPVNQIAQPSPSPTADANVTENSNKNEPRPTVTPTAQPNTNAAPKETPRPTEPKREPPPTATAPPPPPQHQTVTLALIAGLVRGGGGGEANKLILPKNARQVRLNFDLNAKNYREIEARIESVAGAEIWRGKVRRTGGRVALNLPAALFSSEDYLLIVSGLNAAGTREDFQNFYFNSERR